MVVKSFLDLYCILVIDGAGKMPLDLSLYLVTDSTPPILKGRDLCTVVEKALQGGQDINYIDFWFPLHTNVSQITMAQV